MSTHSVGHVPHVMVHFSDTFVALVTAIAALFFNVTSFYSLKCYFNIFAILSVNDSDHTGEEGGADHHRAQQAIHDHGSLFSWTILFLDRVY